MNKYNTKPGQVLSLVNRSEFRSHVKATQSDKYCKGFSAWQQLVTMMYVQLAVTEKAAASVCSCKKIPQRRQKLGMAVGISPSTPMA